MYYRYKTRKKDRRFLKFFTVAAAAAASIYLLYANKSRLMIWKINQNRIEDSIDRAAGTGDRVDRIVELKKLAVDMETYKKENMLDPDAYVMASKLYLKLGLNLDNRDFTEMYIDGSLSSLSRESRYWLYCVIKDINKAIALYNDTDIELDDLLALARAAYLTGYYRNDYIYSMVSERIKNGGPVSVEDARFYSLLCIAAGRSDEGLDYLGKNGAVADSVKGQLFRARVLFDAMKYTEAIMAFQSILQASDDSFVLRVCYLNLGRIYYFQRLYSESLDQYNAAYVISRDNNCRVWIARNNVALGRKDEARKILGEAAAADPSDEDVQALLATLK